MNHLQNEKSPYLIQHRENPVDWYPWSAEAFELAKRENKPVFLSIGYSTCHWCHVMAHESFMDNETARLMNETFVNIKVDREERPDIDQIYMNVCQMLNGSGGWPLNVIMTHDKKPFFAATYLPRRQKFGKIGMIELIEKIRKLWPSDPAFYLETADQVVKEINEPLDDSAMTYKPKKIPPGIFKLAVENFRNNYDETYGGFGIKPKFPGGHNLMFLLRYYYRHPEDPTVLAMVEKTLTEMRKGGVFDQIGYGFHRYSTDEGWFLPHFEKMLYDQAVLGLTYSFGWQITHNNFYKKTVENILDYVLREMTDEKGGFYSAQDADSEGQEGKFYIWDFNEIKSSLDDGQWALFCESYNIKPEGNFREEASSLPSGLNIISMNKERPVDTNRIKQIQKLNEKLYQIREKRIPPAVDDKILTSWNGLMIATLALGSFICSKNSYLEVASKSAQFIWDNLLNNGKSLHRYRENEAGIDANLEDYAFFIFGILHLYQAGGEIQWLKRAVELSRIMIEKFFDTEQGGFFFSSLESFIIEKLIVRSKDYYDGALPCGNAVALYDLVILQKLTGSADLKEIIEKSIQSYAAYVMSYPSGLTMFLQCIDIYQSPGTEIIINGNPRDLQVQKALEYIRYNYLPDVVYHLRTHDNSKDLAEIAPFTESMGDPDKTAFYICQNYSCRQPVFSYDEFLEIIRGGIR